MGMVKKGDGDLSDRVGATWKSWLGGHGDCARVRVLHFRVAGKRYRSGEISAGAGRVEKNLLGVGYIPTQNGVGQGDKNLSRARVRKIVGANVDGGKDLASTEVGHDVDVALHMGGQMR